MGQFFYVLFRTNCAILTSYIHARVVVSRVDVGCHVHVIILLVSVVSVVSLVSVVSVVSFRSFRFGRFVSLFRVLVHALLCT